MDSDIGVHSGDNIWYFDHADVSFGWFIFRMHKKKDDEIRKL